MQLDKNILNFLEEQGIAVVSTFDEQGRIHCAVKGLAAVKANKIFVIDLYRRKTHKNLKRNSAISVTVVDEQSFEGYTFQGNAKVIPQEEIQDSVSTQWEQRIVHRISNRLIRNIRENAMSNHHEADLPEPRYLIEVEVESVIDLSPPYVASQIV